MKYFALFGCFLLCFLASAQDKIADSLQKQLKVLSVQAGFKQDTNYINTINELSNQLYNNKPDSTFFYAQQAILFSEKINYTKGVVAGLRSEGLYYYVKGNYPQALNVFHQAISIQEKIGDQKGLAANLNSIGNIYHNQQEYEKALTYFNRSLVIRETINDQQGVATNLNNIGNVYYFQKNDSLALDYFEKGLKIREKIIDNRGLTISFFNIGKVYQRKQRYQQAIEYYNKAIVLSKKIGNKRAISFPLNGLAQVYQHLGEYEKSISYAEKGLELVLAMKNLAEQKEFYATLYNTYKQKGDYPKSLHYHELFEQIEDSLFSMDKAQLINNLETKAEIDRKNLEIAKEKASKEFQQRINYLVGFLLFLSLIFAFFVWQNRKKIQRANQSLNIANQEITDKNEEIKQQQEELVQNLQVVELQKSTIEIQNNDMKASINYALRIQKAIIPSEKVLQNHFDCFVFFRPRDIVSGDFYWFAVKENTKILAVADCTGHGVSGAFMTMIGNNILNHLVHDLEVHEPDEILNKMSPLLANVFSNSEKTISDGMDISMIKVTSLKETFEYQSLIKIDYAGAMNSLYYVQGNNLKEIKADKLPIDNKPKPNFAYKKHSIYIENNKTMKHTREENNLVVDNCNIYLCSDGYQDQFGGTENRKFMANKFKMLLAEIADKSTAEQKEILNTRFDNWKSDGKQTDDVLVIGIKFS